MAGKELPGGLMNPPRTRTRKPAEAFGGNHLTTANRDRLSLKVAVLLFSTLLSLFGAEWLYRFKLTLGKSRQQIDYSYRVASNVPVEYDENYGEHPKPNLESFDCFVRDGRVAWGSVVTHSNRDGLGGKTTLEEYEKADIRILVFGDSFSDWTQGGATWPDLLQAHLERDLGKKVAVVDYGRAGYGVLQMLDLAATKINQLHPNLAIIAAIGDDFSRARWWSREVDKDGMTRFMLSTRKNNFDDYRFAVDQLLVVPEATRQWCEQELVRPDAQDPTLEKANRQFAKIRREVESVRKAVPLLSWDHSFLYKRLVTGNPYGFPDGNMPRISITDLRQDRRATKDLRRIRKAGTPLLLAYLPTMQELKSRKVIASYQDLLLMNSVERMLNLRFRLVQQEYHGELPHKIDLQPYDWHPNRRGLEVYAAVVAHMALSELPRRSSASGRSITKAGDKLQAKTLAAGLTSESR
ncbi:MAG: SGNH/GDSL hydrolase family protein [Candidatus Binataceae bacterium]